MVRSATEQSPAFYAGCIAWAAGCWWLIRNGLGVIAFVGTILAAIFTVGLREKWDGETTDSAYNVFNRGGKAILGSLTGDQVDAQLRGGFQNGSSQSGPVGDAPLATTKSTATTTQKLSEGDKLKRRSAAAAAAERRLQQQAQEAEKSKQS
ncbi:expressed unknown protein [Seminavis robusta]|uniref:SAYSvFN domain-containing protein n=1 Tax=Seminavis robusta TaxID=568900 RepID=A0A9N8HN18_9STRA|nr:expressed unknown protein [Seminavis robusta]|eukprot:Sro951_g223850.1 n/a (151) ;mRNA; f:11730-12182